ncbi:MAG TPA: cob(I)yrinic acid a,c-diamide adenosyltransferase [Methanomassiliicoccales archaeon]|nr:cob(I)yrinic acid a,c-diamide adenosyltransferase [Methanomassiliicoccales archaeon]
MANESLGLMHVYTGNGKGKSSAAFGLALRAWGQDLRVCIIQWIKSTEYSGEFKAVSALKGVEIRQFGAGRFFGKEAPSPEDIMLAEEGLEFAERALSSGDFDLVVLDELNVAVHLNLLDPNRVAKVLKGRANGVEVVVTGRYAPSSFYDIADYVTEFHAVKHPFKKGIPARRGIEY